MDPLILLERRVEALERLTSGEVGGAGNASDNMNAGQSQTKLIDELHDIQNKLYSLVDKRSTVQEAFQLTPQITKCLGSSLIDRDRSGIPDSVKLKVIESDSEAIEQAAIAFAHIDHLKHVLDSEHIRAAPTLTPKITEVSAKQAALLERVNQQTVELSELVRSYNDVIATINRQMIYWDQQLATVENTKKQ